MKAKPKRGNLLVQKAKGLVPKVGVILMMAAICAAECAADVPPNGSELCDPDRLNGGFVQVFISSCDVDWSEANITSQTFWEDQIAANKVAGTGRVKGGLGDPTEETEDTDACLEPEVSGITWVANISDFNFDLENDLDVTFWNTVVRGRNKWQFALRSPDNYVLGFYSYTLSRKLVWPNTCKKFVYRDLKFSWRSIDEPTRWKLPFLDTLFPI